MFFTIHEHKAPPNNGEDQAAVPSRLDKGVAVGLQDLFVGLGADNEHGVAVEE